MREAQAYIQACLRQSVGLALGSGPQRSMNHTAQYSQWGRGFLQADYSVYAITDPTMNARHSRSMFDAVQAAIEGGATIIQVSHQPVTIKQIFIVYY